jgi:hypothetical protein
MLGAINADSTTNLTKQIELAKAAKYMLEPGETMSPAASASLSALAATILAGPEEDSSESGLAAGAIAGIVIGAVAALVLLGALIFFIRRNRRRKQNSTHTPHLHGTQGMQEVHHYHDSAPLPPYQQYSVIPDGQDKLVEAPGSPPIDSHANYPSQHNDFRYF